MGNGIALFGSGVQNTLIAGNYIGTDVSGLKPLGNAGSGIAMGADIANIAGASPSNTTIGGAAAAAGNVISANGGKFKTGGQGEGVAADGTGLLQNNIIGYDKKKGNLMGMQNLGGGVDLPNTGWTSQNNTVQP